jgi:hypothetical protein
MMTYLRVKWHHNFSADPVLLFSELDAERYETRKVEVFRDGRQGFASENEEHGGSFLGEKPVPELGILAADPEFEPESISALEFEKVWAGRLSSYAE